MSFTDESTVSILEGSPTGLIIHFIGISITLFICPTIYKKKKNKNGTYAAGLAKATTRVFFP